MLLRVERSQMFGILLLLLICELMTSSFVSGDPCAATLGFPVIPVVYANNPVTVIVPMSATCSTSYGNQLYATANAYDSNTQTSAGAVNTILTSVNGGYTFTGQLGFTLPASTQGHWVQIAVTLFTDQAGNEVTSAGEAFQINPGTVQVVTTTVFAQTPSEYAPPYGTQRPRYFIFAYVAKAAILATVIIVTVGLIVYSRRPEGYYQMPRGY